MKLLAAFDQFFYTRAPAERIAWLRILIGGYSLVYLCGRFGWIHGGIQDFSRKAQYDLVICYDVLQYLKAAETQRALANLARVCRGLLYFGVLTREDWEENCDQTRTDPAVSLRGGAWYRRELSKKFRHLGAGFWLRRDCPVTVWEMDTAGRK